MAAIGKSLKLISALCGKSRCWLSERVLGHVHPIPFFSPPSFFFSFLFLSFLTSLLSLSHFSSHFWSHFPFWSSGFGGIISCTSWVRLKYVSFAVKKIDKQLGGAAIYTILCLYSKNYFVHSLSNNPVIWFLDASRES